MASVVGRSGTTQQKQADYQYLVDILLRACFAASHSPKWRGKSWPDRVVVVELNAGDGGTDDCDGSPVIVATRAERMSIPVDLWCCEQNAESMLRLRDRLDRPWRQVSLHYLPGDYNETLDTVIDHYRQMGGRYCFGWMYSDENGGLLPVDRLSSALATRHFTRMDLVTSVAANGAYKRGRGAGFHDRYFGTDLRRVGKPQVYIRRKLGDWQWTMAYCTHWAERLNMSKQGFWLIDTPEGESVLHDLTYTAREKQPRLPFDDRMPPTPNT